MTKRKSGPLENAAWLESQGRSDDAKRARAYVAQIEAEHPELKAAA